MTRTIAVVQARLGSSRFPRKMLAKLGNRTLLEWVVVRVQESKLVDHIVVATTTERIDDELVAECKKLNVEVRRGATDDVLKRFVDVIAGDTADTVVRICADNPFIDAACIDRAIREHLESNAQYSFNHRPFGLCNYADGFGAEVIARDALESLQVQPLSAAHREHVTLALADGSVAVRIHECIAPSELARPELRFDVDLPGDLQRLEVLVSSSDIEVTSSAIQVIAAHDARRGAADD